MTIDQVRAFCGHASSQQRGARARPGQFRIGRIVYFFSRDGSTMGFAFPKEWPNALVEAEPEKFSLPRKHDMPCHWVHVRLDAIGADEMRELVEDAPAMRR